MKECDNSKIHISSNFILSISLLIMLDTLLLRPSLHCNTPLHFTTLHPTTLHYTSLHFTQLHFTTLSDTSLLIYTSLPFHLALRIYIYHVYLLTPCSRVLLQKLTGLQLVKKFLHFREPQGSLPHSQVPATCPSPEPDRSSPYPHISLPEYPS